MGHKVSVAKRIRQAEKARLYNKHYRSMARTAIKKFKAAGTKEEAEALLREAVSILDKLVSKGVYHKNTAAHKKSKLYRHFNSLP